MKSNIVDIINNKLHNFKYLNYTIIFYIIFFYTYYRLFVYLLNKNYIMLLLYFIFFILVYNSYKNFTYVIGFVIIIMLRVFNIDTILNSSSINLVNKFNTNKIENLEVMAKIREKANNEGKELEKGAKNNKPPPNPCKSYIINEVQKAGIKIANKSYNHESKKETTQSELNSMMAGHDDVDPPTIYRLS
jgi:hypothetical protein